MFQNYTWRTAVRELTLILFAIGFSLPIYLVITVALRGPGDLLDSPLSLPTPPRFANLADAWNESGAVGTTSLLRGLVNSVIITGASVTLLVVVGSMAAYFIARSPGLLGASFFGILLAGLMLPSQLTIIPLFTVLRELGLTGSRVGLVVVYLGGMLPMAVLLFTGFIRRLPRELEEAAMLDGTSQGKIFFLVVFPLLRPVVLTVAIVSGMVIWNDFFTPLVVLGGSENATVPVALYSFVGLNATNYPLLFSGVLIAVAPMLIAYVVAQRYIVEGLSGGVRG